MLCALMNLTASAPSVNLSISMLFLILNNTNTIGPFSCRRTTPYRMTPQFDTRNAISVTLSDIKDSSLQFKVLPDITFVYSRFYYGNNELKSIISGLICQRQLVILSSSTLGLSL